MSKHTTRLLPKRHHTPRRQRQRHNRQRHNRTTRLTIPDHRHHRHHRRLLDDHVSVRTTQPEG
ncbi:MULTISPECIES: hypothetical protein, partial [unclassified Streptomyces]|uniref:hypothetical protein n=1 Tax=unclassified Streptomyces TaxID=2593676 RepID=UPI001EF149E8